MNTIGRGTFPVLALHSLLLLLFASLPVAAQTTILTANADTYLRSGSANQAAGTSATLQVQSAGNNRALVRFDPAAIAAAVGGGSLVSAQLELYIAANGGNWGSEGRTVDIHRLTADWTEAGATWNCGIDTNPANGQANCASSWNGGSFEEEPTDSLLHVNGQSGWVGYDVTADVEAFLAGTAPGYGWLVKKTEEGQNGRVDYASRQGLAAQAPRLVLVAESASFDQVPPSLRITAPQITPILNDPSPAISFEFADGGSGIDAASLEVVIDGTILVASCTLGGAAGSCEAPALAAGEHQVRVRIADQFGNQKEAIRDFAVLLGPGLSTTSFPLVADTYLAKGQPNQEHGAESLLRVRKSGDNRALLRVDEAALLAAIGPGLVRSATLVVAITKNGGNWGSAGRPIGLHRLTAPWSEASATWSCAQDSNTTNNQANCSPQWNGGTFTAASGDQLLVTNELTGVVELDVTADLVAATQSGAAGFGWLLKKADDGKSGLIEFGAREGAAASAPRLVLTLELPGMGGDEDPPIITWLAPGAGSWQPTATPALRAQLADAGSGVDPAGVRFILDGVDRSADCQISAAGVECSPSAPLAEGLHAALLQANDLAGNSTESALSFSTDSIAPTIAVGTPAGGRVLGGARLELVAPYADAGSGIDPASLAVALDGASILEACLAETDQATCESPEMEPGSHLLSFAVRDLAGHLATAQRAFELEVDTAPPSLEITAPAGGTIVRTPELTVEGTASDDLEIINLQVDGQEVELAGGAFTATARLDPGYNEIRVVAMDSAGNVTTASREVQLDLEPPRLRLEQPSGALHVNQPAVRVAGIVSDDLGVARLEVGGQPIAFSAEGAFDAEVPLAAGNNAVVVRAFDQAGNQAFATAAVRFVALPEIHISAPADLGFLTVTAVDVEGTVSDPDAMVFVDGIAAEVTGNSFVARDVPLIEGGNILTATITSQSGQAGTDSIVVVRDSTAPYVAIHSPRAGATVFGATVNVAGMVNDIVAGTVNASEAAVTVNGLPALVANRSFLATGIPLLPGTNTLLVRAVDESGNATEKSLEVRRESAAYRHLVAAAGDGQHGDVGTPLGAPLVAQVADAAGLPIAGVPVIFKTLDTNGRFENGRQQIAVTSGADGRASVAYTLGTRSGIGNEIVEASAAGFGGPATFLASALPGEAFHLVVDSGDQQYGVAGQDLPRPLVAVVTDESWNRLQEIPVRFSVGGGGGSFPGGESEVVVLSDSDGRVIVPFTLGGEEGIGNNVVEARIDELPESPVATFTSTGRSAGDAASTSISGVVLDNSGMPIEGVTLRVLDGPETTITDVQGLFRLQPAPVGTVRLVVDGSTAERPGSWPDLEFVLTTIAGRDNTVGMPIYLLPLDLENGLQVSETTGGTIRLPEIPGFALEVQPGSVTFPGGSKNGYVSVTAVHSDRVPMVPNFGQQPRFIVTIQPAGARFDPPARLTLPNVEGLGPREVTEMYSFDHDLGHFVSIGPATVSRDGATIVANAGVGVIKAGWHCGGNPTPAGTPHCCDPCNRCNGSKCVADDTASCSDHDPCTDDFCRGGSCQHRKTETRELNLFLNPDQMIEPSFAGSIIAGIEPRCPGVEVDFKSNQVIGLPGPGGHFHSLTNRPLGKAKSCTTNKLGFCRTVYRTGIASGMDSVMGRADDQFAFLRVEVGVPGLQKMGPGASYGLIGGAPHCCPQHPSNHWAKPWTIFNMAAIAARYHELYPQLQILKVNDMSLELGGLFDFQVRRPWTTPHAEHRVGRTADVRIKDEIPPEVWGPFKRLVREFHAVASIHSPNDLGNIHFHITFEPGTVSTH